MDMKGVMSAVQVGTWVGHISKKDKSDGPGRP